MQVINVTQDAVWAREAVLPGLGTVTRPTGPDLVRMFGTDGEMPETIEIPQPRLLARISRISTCAISRSTRRCTCHPT